MIPKNRQKWLNFAITLGLLTIAAQDSAAYDIDLGPVGHLCDTCGGGVIGGLPIVGHSIQEAIAQGGAPVLEQWIIQSRNSAVGTSMPIPPDVARRLSGYSSPRAIAAARYKIGDNGFVNLANVLEKGGFASAVTLIDVIVFRGPSEANDLSIWAHELTHVDQYLAWGTRDFAIRYVRDYHAAEDPAYSAGNNFAGWDAQHTYTNPAQFNSRWPSGTITQPCGCWGPTTGINPDPRCQSGAVRANVCMGVCVGGTSPYLWTCQ